MQLKGTIKSIDLKCNYGEIVLLGSEELFLFHPLELNLRVKRYDRVQFERDELYNLTSVAKNVALVKQKIA